MRKVRRRSFADLVKENKQALLQDRQAMEELEQRLEARREIRRMEKAE